MSSPAPLLLVSFVSSRGWTSRTFSHAQFERALPQLEGLDFPLLVSEYHPDDDAVKASSAGASSASRVSLTSPYGKQQAA